MSTVTAYVRNVMAGPAAELLERRLIGQFKITNFEIQSMHSASQEAFIGLLQARIVDTIGRMADVAIGRDDVRDYNHMRGEFPRIARSSVHEINGLRNIMANDRGMLHHIHAPGEDGPDDPGASQFWKVMNGPPVLDFERSPRWWVPESDAAQQDRQRREYYRIRDATEAMRAAQGAVREPIGPDGLVPMPTIITTRAVRDRYAATLERLARERNEAAYEWTRLRPWQWRKRRRLWRKLYGIGGWRVDVGPVDYGIPERVTPCGRLGRLREGGC